MGRLGPVAAFLALLALFLIANRGAYENTFSDDDLDNIAWTRTTPSAHFLRGLASPLYYPNHFRPVGHFAYHVLANTAGLRFAPYIATLQVLHLATTILLALLLLRLGLARWQAAAGALFFVFHMGMFDALWKPMYLFDVWCGLFCAAALILYIDGRTALSLLAFWLAYKSKEQAVALPAVLLVYEWLIGTRQWQRIAPFAAIAASFALQGVLMNREAGADYRLQFTPGALAATLSFYGGRAAPLVFLPLLLLVRHPRVLFGLLAAMLFMGPLWFLPTRMAGAYLYVALAALAIAVAAAMPPRWHAVVPLALLWISANYATLRDERRAALTIAHENRAYLAALASVPQRAPGVHRFIYDGFPRGLRWWGILGALRVHYNRQDLEMKSVEDKDLTRVFAEGDVALLKWNAARRELAVVKRSPGEPDHPFIRMDDSTPIWQLESGWYQGEHRYRWTQPRAVARLQQPAAAREFTVDINVGPRYIADVKRAKLEVSIEGAPVGEAEFTTAGWQTVRWPAPAITAARTVRVTFTVSPEYRPSATDPRVLGLAIGAFGFPATNP
ncbi:MAG: hypothetical protein FJW31_12980 [Acidobacteria bacterium]|nr:hypothetical protein [Acidobacteriota bacterium]